MHFWFFRGVPKNQWVKIKTVFKEGSSFRVFLLSLLVTGLGFGIYKGVIDNYMAEIVGMGMLSVVTPTKLFVTIAICIYSLGEHIQLGMKNTLSLEYAKENQGGQALGYQNSAAGYGRLSESRHYS